MDRLRPVGWGDIATKTDQRILRVEQRLERAERAVQRLELAEQRRDMAAHRARVQWTLVFTIVASNATLAGLLHAALRFT